MKRVEMRPSAPPAAWERLDSYLEALTAPLVGVVPPVERARLKQETLFHLERLREDAEREGFTGYAAVEKAIETYGAPPMVAERFLESWGRRAEDGPLIRRYGRDRLIGLGVFGVAQTLCVIVFQMRVFLPSDSVFRYAINPALLREILPPGFPLPELTPLYFLAVLCAIALPVVAGWIVGLLVPFRPGRAALVGVIPATLYSVVSGVMLLPMKEMLYLALGQILWWIPISVASAWFASLAARERGRAREWQG
jgi:hypothetical protein